MHNFGLNLHVAWLNSSILIVRSGYNFKRIKFEKIYISLALLASFALQGFAQPVIPGGDFVKKLQKAAGKQGQFVVDKDNFPKSYFLVHQNLPFLAGLALHHPKSSTLKLSKEQIEAVQDIKKRTVPVVIKMAQDIKLLELKLVQNVAIDSNTPQSQFEIIDAIAKLRTDLTKAHIVCINEVREVLSREQYERLLGFATKMGHKPKSNKFKIDPLVFLPSPGRLIKQGKVQVTKEQMQRINKEVKAIYPPIFQAKMREAFDIQKKTQRMVAKGKSKKEMKSELDQIAALKREAVDGKIDALNHFKKILTPEQWNKIVKLSYK